MPSALPASNASATFCIEAIQRILGNRAWKDDLENYPPFPMSFWSNSGLSGVPRELLGLYEAKVDEESDSDDSDGAELHVKGRKRARALASENPRNVKHKLAKAAAKDKAKQGESLNNAASTSTDISTSGSAPLSVVSSPKQKRTGPAKGATKKVVMKF